jgi:hypothetical protein
MASPMKLVIRAPVVVLALALLAFGGQKPRRGPAQRVVRSPAIDYSIFSHTTEKHRGECSTCHKVPTGNWKTVRAYPDVADYPGHDACVSCHRPQFFKGAKPAICTICHSKVSPRDDVRFAFRKPAGQSQFSVEFPHDKHQDVIARNFRSSPSEERPLFLRASFARANFHTDEQTKRYNNCEICHAPLTNPPAAPARRWPDGFAPDALTFKSVPVSHASCFNCHWKSEEPVAGNCAGCHKPGSPTVLSDLPKRISLKFRHEGAGATRNHVSECTACHINITRSATLRGLKPDVPITSCSECHNKAPNHLEISNELEAIDKNRDFRCVYCHTSDVGRLDPPASHYLIAERAPRKRTDPK